MGTVQMTVQPGEADTFELTDTTDIIISIVLSSIPPKGSTAEYVSGVAFGSETEGLFCEQIMRDRAYQNLDLKYLINGFRGRTEIHYRALSTKVPVSTGVTYLHAQYQNGILRANLWPEGKSEPTKWMTSYPNPKVPPAGVRLVAMSSKPAKEAVTHTYVYP